MRGLSRQDLGHIVTPANVVLVLGAGAIVCTLLWAMHEDAQHELRRERMEQRQQQAQGSRAQQPSAEQRRHMAAQFVCGHGVGYQWVDGNTVECYRESGLQAVGR